MLIQAQRASPEINFVFANQGEDITLVTRYLASAGLAPVNILFDAKSHLGRLSEAQRWPTTLYLDADGQMLASDTGELTATKLSRRLAELRGRKTD